ncbi:MAG: hypothetical protein KA538_12360 [Azonexus sp.]|jgi:hypothetical protein|nr:hypothetical protein [Azonexus sp.]
MKTRRTNYRKERERFLVESFIRNASLQAEIVEAREAPDFIIRVDGKLLGLEVTELFVSDTPGGESLQARESISSQIVANAQRLYQAAHGAPVHLSMCFFPGMSLRDINRDKTAQAICDFVLALDIAVSERIDWRPEDYEDQQIQLPEQIAFVHALGVPSFDMAHWAEARAGWVAPLEEASLQQRINEKAKRIATYRNAIPTNWLLVVADAMKPSSLIKAKSNFAANNLRSPFDRTFFYRHPDDFIELCVGR